MSASDAATPPAQASLADSLSSASIPPLSAPSPASSPASSRYVHFDARQRMKMVLCVRNDLGMTKGKMCAQCCHAAVGVVDDMRQSGDERLLETLSHWDRKGAMKIALRVDSEEQLQLLEAQAESLQLPHYLVVDAGHTQVAPDTRTVLAIGPAPVEMIDQICGQLKLL